MDLKEKAKLITIKSKEKVLNLLEGGHRTFIFGEDDDLKNIREYTYGDDIRFINWIITARERKPFIVEREELKNITVRIVLLIDQEFLFKDKLEKLIEIFSLLSFAALYKKDRVEIFILTERLEKILYIKENIYAVENISQEIVSLDLRRKKLNPEIIQVLNQGKRSITILIGDFLYPVNILPLSYRHKLFLVILRTRDEENPHKYRGFQLKSFDEKRKIPVLRNEMLKEYIKNVKNLDKNLESVCYRRRIKHIKIYTDQDPLLKLRQLFV